jgi:hypothetical protein
MYERYLSPDSNIRIGDAEREQVADQLRTSHTEGRLDVEEFNERIDAALKAKTRGDLRALVADLPGAQQGRRPAAAGGERMPFLARMLAVPFFPFLLAVVLVAAISHGHFWVIFPLFFLARFLMFRFGYGPWWMRHRGGYYGRGPSL